MTGNTKMKKSFSFDRKWWQSLGLMLVSVVTMGLGVSVLVLTEMGTDPCSSMNYGFARLLHLSFGTWQAIFNIFLLIIVLFFDKSLVGLGTLGNMFIVGYSADFFTWIRKSILNIPDNLPLSVRGLILIPALLIFIAAAACYMNSGHGMAPYDAVPFLISRRIQKKTGRDLFKVIRLSVDSIATAAGFLTGGEVGLMTILMVILLAPAVSYAGKILEKHF